MDAQNTRDVPPAHTGPARSAKTIIDEILSRRGVRSGDEAVPSLRTMPSPDLFKQMDVATGLLLEVIDRDEPILVVGDYDCDGATATAIVIRGLRMMGVPRVAFCVPNRLVHGYGLGVPLIDDVIAKRRERPALIITVDNGIVSHAGVERAHQLGMRVLVTDHHLPGATLPAADAIVNPAVPDEGFPSRALCGAGVAFYLMLALRARMRKEHRFNPVLMPEPDLSSLLDLVALGTVADVVPLDGLNRGLVTAGLRRIHAGNAHPGIRALFTVANRKEAMASASDLGFYIGPRINAAGRIEDMGVGIRCLLEDGPKEAMVLAKQLGEVNDRRKERQETMVEQAQAMIDPDLLDPSRQATEGGMPHSLVLNDPRWHEGVVGLVASRIREGTGRPVFAFAPAQNASMLKGSGRSIAGFHLRDALVRIDATHPGLIERYGGHAMAAGLSLEASRLAEFREAFEAVARESLDASAFESVALTDGSLRGSEITRELAETIERYPWGQGFPEPVFEIEADLVDWKCIGDKKQYWSLVIQIDGDIHRAVCFKPWAEQPSSRFQALARISMNRYRDQCDVNLLLDKPQGRIERRA